MNSSSRHPVETILGRGLRRLLTWGVPLALLGLIFPAPAPDSGLLAYSLAHLVVLQVVTFLFAIEMADLTDEPWFAQIRRPWLASCASLVAAVVGFSALLALASSATARYEASMQFLQLLSSLDIAWVVATLYLGVRRLARSRVVPVVLGLALLVACVISIAVYLVVVGFEADGGWLVDGSELLRLVIPADTFAAVVSVTVLLVASRRADQTTEQARLQS